MGLVASPVAAYFQTAAELKQLTINYAETTRRVTIAMADPKCVAIHNSGNGINSMSEGLFCFTLWGFWGELSKYQGPPPDYKGIRDAMSQEELKGKLQDVYLPALANIFGLYILFLAGIFASFLVGKWIYKGFKPQ